MGKGNISKHSNRYRYQLSCYSDCSLLGPALPLWMGAQFKLLHHPRPVPSLPLPTLQQLSALGRLLMLDFQGFWHQANTLTLSGADTCIGCGWSQAQVAPPLQRVSGEM